MNKYPFKKLLCIFLTFSVLGWCMETVYRSLYTGSYAHGGFSTFPFSPIYGGGVLIIMYFQDRIDDWSVGVRFLFFSIILTIYEYLSGVFGEFLWGRKLWDYSDTLFNFHGHVSLLHSIYWGILALLFLKYMLPFFEHLYHLDPKQLHKKKTNKKQP